LCLLPRRSSVTSTKASSCNYFNRYKITAQGRNCHGNHIQQAKLNTIGAKYFNRPFQQETSSMALIKKRAHKINYVIFQRYHNSKIYEISQVSIFFKEFSFFKNRKIYARMWSCRPQYVATLSTVQHCSTPFNTVQHCSTPFNTVQHCSTLFNTVQHCSTLFNTVQHNNFFFWGKINLVRNLTVSRQRPTDTKLKFPCRLPRPYSEIEPIMDNSI
jgi:hypothetical protein